MIGGMEREMTAPEPLSDASRAELRGLILAGNTVSAIKHYRAIAKCGLKDAKDWVERYIEELMKDRRPEP